MRKISGIRDYVYKTAWERRGELRQPQPKAANPETTPPKTAREPKTPIMTIDQAARQNYNLFALTFPRIMDGTYQRQQFKDKNNHKLTVSHDVTNAGLIHAAISYYSPDGQPISDPTIAARANFERRMLTAENYANTRTGEDIGLLTLAAGTDEEKTQLGLKLAEFISDIREPSLTQDFHSAWTLEKSEAFRDADGRELSAEPKVNLMEFLTESANREADAWGRVQRSTSAPAYEPEQAPQPAHQPQGTNFRITDDHLGEGGARTKFSNNVDTIKTIKAIEYENRAATPEEQEILSRYVGWGGLPQVFDEKNESWSNEYALLKAFLSPEEYESARGSTLNAHYTSPVVIKAIWETVERMGFKSGNILEPSCGVGNFFGLIPQDLWQSERIRQTTPNKKSSLLGCF